MAKETSPDDVKLVGRFDVTAVVETEKREEPLSVTLNRLPVVSPLAPMLILNRSPEAVAGLAGDQSRDINRPDERLLEIDDRLKAVPEEILSAV